MRNSLLLAVAVALVSGCTSSPLASHASADELIDEQIALSAATLSLAQQRLHATAATAAPDRGVNGASGAMVTQPPSAQAFAQPVPAATTGRPVNASASPFKVSTPQTVAPPKAFPSTPAPAPIVVNVIAAPLAPTKPAAPTFASFASMVGQTLVTAPISGAVPSPAALKVTHPVPAAPVVVAEPVEAPWVIAPGDITLRRALNKWAQRAGWQLVWDASVDVPVSVNASFTGGFNTAVTRLFQSLSAADVNLSAVLYSGNRVLRVTESGRRAQ